VKWAGWTRTKIKDPAKIDKVILTYVLCHFLASDCVTSQIFVYRHSSMLHRWQSRLAGTGWSGKHNIRPLSSVQQSRSWLSFIY